MIKQRYIILSLMAGIFLLAASVISKIEFKFDYTGKSLANQEELFQFENSMANFESNRKSNLIIIEHKNKWQARADFELLANLTDAIGEVEGKDSVFSISSIYLPEKTSTGIYHRRLIDFSSSKRFQKWQKNAAAFTDISSKFLSSNYHYTILYVQKSRPLELATNVILNEYSKQTPTLRFHILSPNQSEEIIANEFKRETILLSILCFILILVTFFLFTYNFKGLIFVFLFSAFNIASTLLFMYFMGISFSLQMIALPCLIIILSFSDIMHILYYQTINQKKGIGTPAFLRNQLIQQLKVPIFFTSFSNLIGFILFYFLAENEIFSALSIVSIFAVIIAYLSSRYLMLHFIKMDSNYLNYEQITKITSWFKANIRFSSTPRKPIVLLLSIFLIVSLAYLSKNMKIDTAIQNGISQNSTLNESQQILIDHFYGSRQGQVIIQTAQENNLWTIENLRKIELIEKEIQRLFAANYVESPATIFKRFNRFQLNGKTSAYIIPDKISPKRKTQISKHFMDFGGGDIIANNGQLSRIQFGFIDKGLAQNRANYEILKNRLREMSTMNIEFKLSGLSYLADQGNYTFSKTLIKGWILGILISTILLSLYLKSPYKGFAIFLVNALPIFTVLIIMPHIGLDINPQSLFLLTILSGLCIDDSIYIMIQEKAKRTFNPYPVIVTSIVLLSGFLTFSFSSYDWLSPFALLFLIGIVIALFLDLLVLPLLLRLNNKMNG